MKKILLTTAAFAAISTSAFADMMENQVYLRGDLVGSYFTKFKSGGNTGSTKIKPQFGFGIDVGAGYYIMDNLRAELIYNHPFASNMKGSRATGVAPAAGTTATTNVSVKHKPTINALIARLHGDVIDLGMGKIFLTGGLGWAQVKDSVTATYTNVTAVAPVAPATALTTTSAISTDTVKHKNKNNLVWTIGAGAAFDVAEGVHFDLAYSYRDYGKAKSAKSALTGASYGGAHFTSHNVTAGVRFDI